MTLLKPGAELIGILEAAYANEPDPIAWAASLAEAVRDCATTATLGGLTVVAHGDNFEDASLLMHVGTDGDWTERSRELGMKAGLLQPRLVRALYYPGKLCMKVAEVGPTIPEDVLPAAKATFQNSPDAFALFAHPTPGTAVVMWTMLGAVQRMAIAERRALSRIATHLDGAFRLRMRPESAVAAVLAPDGRLLELQEPEVESQRAAFGSTVVAIEKSRLRARRSEITALDEWRALVAGRYSLVPREDRDGKRYYLMLVNGTGAREHARLSPLEVDVLSLAARGVNGKGTSYALGISQTTVSTALAQAATKLGLPSRTALVQVAVLLLGTQRVDATIADLTPAEREVLQLLRRGLSNTQIAELRSASKNTVANQVSSILRKTGSAGRRELSHYPVGSD